MGSVLAAVGTALPETMIPVVALVSAAITGEGSEAAGEIGIGAILGAPFLLATLAMFVTGAGILGYQRRRRNGANVIVDERVISHDVLFFLIFFTIAAAAGVAPLPTFMRIVVAAVLVLAYVLYVVRTIRGGGGAELEEVPENLTLWPNGRGTPPTWAVWAQLVAALLIMVFGARTFVHAVEAISEGVGIPAGLIALVLAPLATELPEKFNSVIWVRDDKDTLALGNITGAMVFQSTLPVTLGILLTRWELGFLSIVSVVLALISGGFIYLMLRRKEHIHAWHLLVGGAFYAVFLVVALFTLL